MKKATIMMVAILASLSTSVFAQESDTFKNDALRKTKGYIVFAMGKNTISNSQKEIYDNLNMGKSRFYEIGYARNARLSEKDNLLHLNYGLSLVYNNVRMKNGYAFKQEEKDITAEYSAKISDARLRNSYLQIPVYLEFDFTPNERLKDPNKILKQGFKIGVGGFMGYRLKTKQFVEYKDDSETTFKNFKTNKFTYGIGAYVGYGFASLYVKYDIREMFQHNKTNNPHNFSFGVRIDL